MQKQAATWPGYDGVRYGFRAEEAESFEDMLIRTRTEGFGDEVKRRHYAGRFRAIRRLL